MFAYCNNNPILYADNIGSRCVAAKSDMMAVPPPLPLPDPYAVVADGTIDMYIVDNGKAAELMDNLEDTGNYIVVEDKRETPGNANIKIHNSYLITDSEHQREVLEYLLKYTKDHPSTEPWTRELDEMLNEWDYHNYLANKRGFAFSRTGHVDLDELDKNKSVWTKGIEYLWEKIKS